MSKVYCIFERNEDDNWKGELLAIYENHLDALKHLELARDNNLFWECWDISKKVQFTESRKC